MDSLAKAEKNGAAFLTKLGATSIADARKKSAEESRKTRLPAWETHGQSLMATCCSVINTSSIKRNATTIPRF